jgi:hypothetical protein
MFEEQDRNDRTVVSEYDELIKRKMSTKLAENSIETQ